MLTTEDVLEVPQLALLEQIRAHWSLSGWDPDALSCFDMVEADGDKGKGKGDDDDGDDSDDDDSDDDSDDDRGKGSKREVLRDLRRERTRRQAAEKERKELDARLKKIESGQKSDADKALEQAREEAAEAARKESDAENAALIAEKDRRIVRAEAKVLAIAGGVKADKVDRFLKLLDLDDFDLDDDGEIDKRELKKLIKTELDEMPEFKADGGTDGGGQRRGNGNGNGDRKSGGFDGGARRGNEGKSAIELGRERARQRFGTGDKKD